MKNYWQKYFWLLIFIPQILSAQFYFFGRNKVQYEKFDWNVIHTEHFDIYYYDDFYELAKFGASYAEESYELLKVKFNHIITNKIPLIFYNTHSHFQQTNTTPGFIPEGIGGFFEFMKGRVVIPYLGSLTQFKHVIQHELVHVFTTNKIYNELYDHRITTERMPPLWFIEGLAEYWSNDWDTQSEMVMRDAVLNGMFVTLKNIESIYGSYLMYKEGQKFLMYVSKNYGEDKILSFIENFWRFKNFIDVIQFTLNKKIEDVDENWQYEIRREYFPLYQNNYPQTILSKKITSRGYNFAPKVFDNHGKKEIYFIGNFNGYTSLMKLNYNTDTTDYSEPEILIEGEKEQQFESLHLMEQSLDVSSTGIIAFITFSKGHDVIHLYSIKDKTIIQTLEFDYLIRIKNPSFSKDASKIVFTATDRKGFSDIYIFNFDTKELIRMTNDYYDDIDPIFSPDESKLIFSSDRTDGIFKRKYNLFEINTKSNEIKYLTYVNANISSPQISLISKEIFFNCDYDGIYDIWKMDYGESSNGMVKVSNFLTSVYGFSFIDEESLITSAFEKFTFNIYEFPLRESEHKKFVQFNYDNVGTSWIEDTINLDPTRDVVRYKKEYTLDYAVSQFIADPVYGNQGGAFLTLSDMLGDDRFLFYVYNTAEVQSEILKNFNIAISRISLKDRTNYGYGVFHFSG